MNVDPGNALQQRNILATALTNLGPMAGIALNALGATFEGFSSAYHFCCDLLIDGQHPAKQLKYYCMLAEIAKVPEEWKIQLLTEGELTPFQSAARKALEHVIHPAPEIKDDYRKRHHEFIAALRKALNEPSEECWEQEVVKTLVRNLYETKLYTFTEELIRWAITKGCSEAPEEITKMSIEKMHEAIQKLPQRDLAPLASIWYHSIKATLGLGFDPMLEGNPPYALFDVLIDGKWVQILRTAAPVYTVNKQIVMTPEYRAFLKGVESEQKRIVYCSLQSLTDGTEKTYSKAIQEGFEGADLYESFCALDQDSLKPKDLPRCSEALKIFLLNALYNDQHFHLPESWKKNRQFRDLLSMVLDHISDAIFEKKSELEEEERRDFLDIFHSYFVFCLIGFFKPDYLTICCRDAADRHGKVLFLLHLMITLFEGINPQESHFERAVLTLAPSLIGRKMPMLQERFERLVASHIHLLTPAVRERFFEEASLYEISHQVVENPYQKSAWQNQIRSS